ncbi:MAG: Zn-ribbon containing protein [Halovenus sp.]
MPHECTDCGRTFADGSKEMLSGCPDCGGNTFQFKPADADDDPPAEPPAPPDPPVDNSVARTVGNAATAVRDLVGSGGDDPETGAAPPGPSGQDSPEADQPGAGGPDPQSAQPRERSMAETEDEAQASARTDVVSPDDLPSSMDGPAVGGDADRPDSPVTDGNRVPDDGSRTRQASGREGANTQGGTETQRNDGADRERPDLSQLREELNEQFESIRVLNPGQYELNLMELYNREEYIIALQEDGKYTIQVPERWEDE